MGEAGEQYKKEIDHVLKELGSKKNGLSLHEAKKRLERDGPNEIIKTRKLTKTRIFLDQFKDVLIIILILSTIISFAIGERADAAIIIAIVIFNSLFGFFQEYRAEKAIEALKKLTSLKSTVIRDGKEQVVDSTEIVPGDIILLEAGNKVPADARIIESFNMEADESSLTGESMPTAKNDSRIESACPLAEQHNMVFFGTTITKGRGKAIVVATAMTTEIGKIAKKIEEVKEEKTPLQIKLKRLSKYIGLVIMIVAFTVFIIDIRTDGYLQSLIFGISLAVAAIPEGLPAVVTIAFALGVQKMIRQKALMRKLSSIETLGTVDIICTDKTGTLTKNEMTVKKIFANNEITEITGDGYNTTGEFRVENLVIDIKKARKKLGKLLLCGSLCNDAVLAIKELNEGDGNDEFRIIGDPTEGALLVAAKKAGLDYELLKEKNPRIDEVPFTSEKKHMMTVHEVEEKKHRMIYAKGAPEEILKLCTKVEIDGRERKLDDNYRKIILEWNDVFAKESLRVLGFAYKEHKAREKYSKSDKKHNHEFTFIGLEGMKDPVREGIRESIKVCKNAGIRTIMITGDFKVTAEAIANELRIEGEVMSGDEIERISDNELIARIDNIGVYARVNPLHKLRIVSALQRLGHVVSMTGDGINDAPALKKANVGVAVGSGTDVAKEASHMIITDDNFSTIVSAIEEGRGIYDNIRKFIAYMLSCNIAEVLIIMAALILGLPMPLTAIQILWLNIVTDGFPALALSLDPKEENIMRRKPRKSKESIITRRIAIIIGTLSLFITAALVVLMKYGLLSDDIRKMQTLIFTAIMIIEMVVLFAIRHEFDIAFFSNKYLFMAILASIVFQLAVIYWPLAVAFGSVHLIIDDWTYILIISVSLVAFSFALKRLLTIFSEKIDG